MAGTSAGENHGRTLPLETPHGHMTLSTESPPWPFQPTLRRIPPQVGLSPRPYQLGRQEAYSEPERASDGPFRVRGGEPSLSSLAAVHLVFDQYTCCAIVPA